MTDEPQKGVQQTLHGALLSFETETGVLIPRKTDLARHLWLVAVMPLVSNAIQESARQVQQGDDDGCHGNRRWCSDETAHDTHVWDWHPDENDTLLIRVRCPGRGQYT